MPGTLSCFPFVFYSLSLVRGLKASWRESLWVCEQRPSTRRRPVGPAVDSHCWSIREGDWEGNVESTVKMPV